MKEDACCVVGPRGAGLTTIEDPQLGKTLGYRWCVLRRILLALEG